MKRLNGLEASFKKGKWYSLTALYLHRIQSGVCIALYCIRRPHYFILIIDCLNIFGYLECPFTHEVWQCDNQIHFLRSANFRKCVFKHVVLILAVLICNILIRSRSSEAPVFFLANFGESDSECDGSNISGFQSVDHLVIVKESNDSHWISDDEDERASGEVSQWSRVVADDWCLSQTFQVIHIHF